MPSQDLVGFIHSLGCFLDFRLQKLPSPHHKELNLLQDIEILESIELFEEGLLYLATCLVLGTSWWWISRSPQRWRRAVWPFWGAVLSTALVMLFPHRLEIGENVERFNVNPLHGLSQILLLDDNTLDPWFSQAWALGNVVLLWPVTAVLIGWGWSARRILWSLLVGITALELVQFGLASLNRAFEVADIVANVGGAWLLLTLKMKISQQKKICWLIFDRLFGRWHF